MEATVVATAMPTVIAELGGLELYGWVGSAYLLSSTVTVPLYGKLADLYGRKPVLLFSIALFLLGSIASGLATSIHALIIARAVQGLGAGGMQPIALTIVGDIYTVEERGRVQGVFGAVWATSAVAGPLLGGLIVDVLSWHWVFLVNVPIGAIAIVLHVLGYPEKVTRQRVEIDLLGALTLGLAGTALLCGASGVWPAILLPIGAALTIAFVMVERRAPDPLLPLDLLSRRTMAIATIVSFLLGATMIGELTFLPLYVQGSLGGEPTAAGMTVAPMLVGWPIAAAATSRMIVRIGFRGPIVVGSLVSAVALIAVEISREAFATVLGVQIAMFAYGIGMGLANTAVMIGVQSSVGREQRGVATATTMFARMMGGALGVAALGGVLSAAIGDRLSPDAVRELLTDRSAPLSPEHVALLSHALRPVFITVAALSVVNLAFAVFYPAHAVKPRESVIETPG